MKEFYYLYDSYEINRGAGGYVVFRPVCCGCGTFKDIKFEPNPFREEINGDETPEWQCEECILQSAWDI